jgi:hypothetical protein
MEDAVTGICAKLQPGTSVTSILKPRAVVMTVNDYRASFDGAMPRQSYVMFRKRNQSVNKLSFRYQDSSGCLEELTGQLNFASENPDENERLQALIGGFYVVLLERLATPSELKIWVDAAKAQSISAAALIFEFVHSTEFQARWQKMAVDARIKMIYRLLSRQPESLPNAQFVQMTRADDSLETIFGTVVIMPEFRDVSQSIDGI